MKYDLTVFVNDSEATSEVFLRQLFDRIGRKCRVELLTYKPGYTSEGKTGYRVRVLKKPLSFHFVLHIPVLAAKYGTGNVRLLYRLYLLSQSRSERIYFPFLYMLSPYTKALPLFLNADKKKTIFSSIRGTEVTVNPYTKPDTLATYKFLLPHIHKLHFLSSDLRERFFGFDLTSEHHRVIYQGLDVSKFLVSGSLPKDKLRMITIGRFNFVKGIEFLLLACSKLKSRNVDFSCSLVGNGPEEEKLRFMVNDLNLTNEVHFLGSLGHENLPSCFKDHNVYVHPHLVTGISNSMLEAFGCGLKTIAFYSRFDSYRIQDICKYFTEVDRYNYDQLAAALARFDFDYEISIEERLRILSKFTLDNQVNQFLEFFDLKPQNDHGGA